MRRYAEGTEVSVARTQEELRNLLRARGADQLVIAESVGRILVGFEVQKPARRAVRFEMPLPPVSAFSLDGRGVRRSMKSQLNTHEKELRRRWRALLLVIRAKLESVASGVEQFDEAFLAQLVLPGGVTVAGAVRPQLDEAYASGKPLRLLPETTS